MNKASAILFDVDGTLVETKEIHVKALNQALMSLGYDPLSKEEEKELNGLPTKIKLNQLHWKGRIGHKDYDAIYTWKQRYTEQFFQLKHPARKNVVNILNNLVIEGFPLAACSNALQKTTEVMLESAGLLYYFDVILGIDNSTNPKPAPDIWLRAARALRLDIDECVIVEDSDVGYQSAITAKPLEVIRVTGPKDLTYNLFEKYL